MASIKDDEESMYKQLEDAFFGILWCLQTQRKTPLVSLNIISTLGGMLLDFCHMLAFFVHDFGWGSITITWGRYVKYIQLQLPLYRYEGFAIAFWCAVGLAFFIMINAAVVGYSFWTKNFNQLWAIKLLHFVVAIFFNFVFLASLYLLITPWFCDPTTQILIPFHKNGQDVSCFGMPNIISVAFGSISIIFLVFLVFASTLVSVEYEPVENDLDAVSSPAYRLLYNVCLIFMTIDEYFIAKIIPETGHWWEALFNLILSTSCFATVIYFLPYQIQLGNELRGGMLGLLTWAAACAFVTVNMEDNHDHQNRIIDYVLLTGLIPAALAGRYVITLRYAQMKSFAAGLVDQIDYDFKPEEVMRAKFGTRKNELIVGAERNPLVYLPRSMQIFSSSLTTIEIFGRLMWFESDEKRNHEAAYRLYRLAEMAYPDIAYVKLLRASCFNRLCRDRGLLQDQFSRVAKNNPSFSVRFALYRRDMEAKQKGSSNSSSDEENENKNTAGGDDSLDLVAYVEFQKYYLEAQRYNAAAIDAIREFWSLFLQPEITFTDFNNAARVIESQTTKALGTYKTLLIRYPKHVAILTSYAYFLELVMHNGEEAAKYHSRAEEIQSREAELSNQQSSIDGSSNVAAVISIAEDGSIESVNKVLCTLFSFDRMELIGRNIKSIVPSPWKEKHDLYLDNYRTTGESTVIGKPARKLFAQHREGYSFAMNLSIQERRNENGEKKFIAMINRTDSDNQEGVIVITEEGQILLISQAVTKLFGYSAVECLRNNVTLLMIDAYAANHDSYLKRYRDTGVAKVIGTAGRNVPARRKDGTVFPAGLVVEELYIKKERYFMATIVDTTNLKATIYMDGYGIIQNVDNGIGQLLGYHKEQVVGKNIKSIQPPPYNMYHDMYLERYRKTKVSSILKATDGRVLPAMHADGSVVQIRAIIQRIDDGASSNMLFKGVIQRVDNSILHLDRSGFNNEDVIEMTKDGIIKEIDPSVIKLLGYDSDVPPSVFIGQSIEVIIPSMDTRPNQMKQFWIPKCLSDTSSNFYLLAANRNLTVFPVTVNLSMKSPDVVLVRIKDISGLDALITIDELGVILSFNEDSHLLLGHDSDEAIGRNIKFMLAKEIADQHDFFLQRYRETRVATVVGIPRTLNTIHRDKSVLPIEIQVTEVTTGEGRQFVGRLRHLAIEDKFNSEIVHNFLEELPHKLEEIQKENRNFARSNSLTESSVSKGDGSENNETESDDDSSVSSDSFEDDKLIDHEGIDAKLKYIKDTEAEDKSSVALGMALKYLVILYAVIFLAALLVFNLLPNPINLLVMMDKLAEVSNTLGDAVGAARQLQLQQIAGITDGYRCSWVPSDPNACGFADKNNVSADLWAISEKLQDLSGWFSNNYGRIRTPGDPLDAKYSGTHNFFDFTGTNPNTPVASTVQSWPELTLSKMRPYILAIARENDVSKSVLPWNFIIYNREIFYQSTHEIIAEVPNKVGSLLTTELIIHLIFTLVLIVTGIVTFTLILLPRLRGIQENRMLILKLVLMVPRTIIFDFVNVMYRRSDAEDEGGEDGITEVGSSRPGETKIGANALKSSDVTEIVPDRNYRTFAIFVIGLFSLSLPAIAHCAWRYTHNIEMIDRLDFYLSNANIYVGSYSFKWREQDFFATQCPNMAFCNTLQQAKNSLNTVAKDVKKDFGHVQDKYSGDDFFSDVLYRVGNYDPANGEEVFCPSGDLEVRCNPSYNGPELEKFPPQFALKTSLGSGLFIPANLESALVLSNTTNISTISIDSFWTTWLATPIEGKALFYELLLLESQKITEEYNLARTAASASYGVSFALSLFLFLFVFSTVKNNLQNESKHNRSILFMIPIDVVKRNKTILDYVDRVFLDLSG